MTRRPSSRHWVFQRADCHFLLARSVRACCEVRLCPTNQGCASTRRIRPARPQRRSNPAMFPTLDQRRGLRLVTLCVLYSAQGMPDGFVRTGLKTFLIDQGATTSAVGNMVALVSWPWALKWVWGPVVDRYRYHPMGRRRPWILTAQLGLALTLGGILLIPDIVNSLWWLGVMILIANVFASLQDVSVDALAVDLLPERDRGIANGFMFASSYMGQFVGASVIGGLLLTSGIQVAVSVQIVILLSIAAFPLLLRERPCDAMLPRRRPVDAAPEAEERHSIAELFKRLGKAFRVRSSWLAAILALGSMIAVNIHLVVWPVFLQRTLGWTSIEYLRLEGNYSVWAGLGGSIVGGLLASAIGAKRAVALALIALSCVWVAHAVCEPMWSSHAVITGLFLATSAVTGLLSVSLFAMFMGIAWPPVAATQFTSYMAMLNLSYGIGAKLAGVLEAAFEIQTLMVVLGVYQFLLLGILLAIDPGQTRRQLGEEL